MTARTDNRNSLSPPRDARGKNDFTCGSRAAIPIKCIKAIQTRFRRNYARSSDIADHERNAAVYSGMPELPQRLFTDRHILPATGRQTCRRRTSRHCSPARKFAGRAPTLCFSALNYTCAHAPPAPR